MAIEEDFFVKTLENSLAFIENDNLRKKFLSDMCMPHWKKAFLHESVNVNDNYEKYEFLGDIVMGYGFKKYLLEDLQIKDHGVMTNLTNHYLSEKYQIVLAKKLNFHEIVEYNSQMELNEKMLEDVTESFFGVITMVARKLWKHDPYRYQHPTFYGQLFFRWYFKNIETFDISLGKIVDKTFSDHLYYFFSGDSTQVKASASYNVKTKTLKFSDAFFDHVKLYSLDVYTKLKSLKMSGDYQIIINGVVSIFEEHGFTSEWLKEENLKVTFKNDYPSLSFLAKKHKLTRFVLRRNIFSSYDLLAQAVDPLTRKSIAYIIKNFYTSDILEIKKKSYDLLITEKFTKITNP